MGGRLTHFVRQWELITQDPWILSIVSQGYRILFHSPPPLSKTPLHLSSHHPQLGNAIEALVAKGAVERVSNPESPGFYSRLFLIPKKDGSLRPIIDLSTLNTFIVKDHFKMETTASIRAAVLPGHWAVSLDFSDAYFHIAIHPSSRKFLRFTDGFLVYHFKALPFGLTSAPRVFTKVMGAIASRAHSEGARLHPYLDDWLLLHLHPHLLLEDLGRVRDLATGLGLLLNIEKSELIPCQEFTFVGMTFHTVLKIVRIPEARVLALLSLVRAFSKRRYLSAREFLSLLGVLNAAADFVPLGRLHMRPLQFVLLSQWRPNVDSLQARLPVSREFVHHLRWWDSPYLLRQGVPLLVSPPELFLFTDASLVGWGAHLEPVGLMTSGLWSPQESLLHINNLELRSVLLALRFFQQHIVGQSILVSTDNTTVVSYITRQGGTHSPALCMETWDLLTWCHDNCVTIQVRHLPGKLNVLADQLSRRNSVLPAEWKLNPVVVASIFQLFSQPMVDLFATRFNNQLPLFVSPVLDHRAWAIDALSLNWNGLFAYAFPPFILVPRVLAKVRQSQCKLILIAPLWPTRTWFVDLLELLIDYPLVLPPGPNLLSQAGGRVLHENPSSLQLHAWLLSRDESDRKSFLRQLPRSFPRLGDSLLGQSTKQNGKSSVIGVSQGRLIQSRFL